MESGNISREKRLRRQVIVFSALSVLWTAFIISRSLRTADESLAESDYVLALLRRLLPFMTSFLVRKLGHFTEYFILGGLLFVAARAALSLRREKAAAGGLSGVPSGKGRFLSGAGLPAAVGLLVAAADECVQLGVEGRSGELRDVLIDLLGVTAAVLLGALLFRRKDGGI